MQRAKYQQRETTTAIRDDNFPFGTQPQEGTNGWRVWWCRWLVGFCMRPIKKGVAFLDISLIVLARPEA